MPLVHMILLVVAVVCFGLSATTWGQTIWNRLISVGLTAFALAALA